MSHAEYHAWLFRIGTGWLGWSEADTLDSTLSGIRQAYEGRLELLKAIFGGKDEPPPTLVKATGPSLRATLRRLAGKPGKRHP